VTSLILAALMHLPLSADPSDTYEEAHRQTMETGRPMVVMVGAEWCPACKQMENTVIPQARKRGLLARVAFALVDLDRDRDLGRKLTAGGPIPQLIAFHRTPDGWRHRKLIGGQTLEQVEEFINEELAETDTQKAEQPKVETTSDETPAGQTGKSAKIRQVSNP
jgi:thioredoxin-like negative regulator of GroEL